MAFATTDDVGTRLQRTLTEDEEAAVEQTIGTVTGLIIDEVGRDEDWADELDPVPGYLKALCIEKAVGVIANPENLAATSETLGAHSYSQTFPRAADIGIFLTDRERRAVRSAVRASESSGASFQPVPLRTPYSGDGSDDLPELALE